MIVNAPDIHLLDWFYRSFRMLFSHYTETAYSSPHLIINVDQIQLIVNTVINMSAYRPRSGLSIDTNFKKLVATWLHNLCFCHTTTCFDRTISVIFEEDLCSCW